MLKMESIKKYVALMKKAIAMFLAMLAAGVKLLVCVSTGNSKIGRVMNVSTASLITCGNCSHCMRICYDIRSALFHQNTTLLARARNTAILQYDRDMFFDQIREKIRRRRVNKFFRWHVGGEIIDLDYFSRMVEIAREFPAFRFWTYTKMHNIVNAYCDKYGRAAIPENFNIMFSLWDGMPCYNPYKFRTFACKLKDGNKDFTDADFAKMYKCPGNCDICKAAHTGCIYGNCNVYADQH